MADLFESGETVNSEEVKVIDNEVQVEHEMGTGIAQVFPRWAWRERVVCFPDGR